MQYRIISLVLILLITACSQSPSPKKDKTTKESRTIPVKVRDIIPQKEALPILASGIVASQEELKLAFKVGGVISAVYVNEGDRVKKGQVLARLDPSEIKAHVAQAKSGFAKAKRDLERVQRLYEDTVATLEQVQDLQTAKELAENSLKIAEFNERYANIYASSSGRVLKRFAEKGEIIGPGNPVYYIAANQSAQVLRLGLTDIDIVQVNIGDEANIQFDAWPNRVFKGSVTEIAAGSDPASGTYEVEIAIKSEKIQIKNGFIGKAQIFPQLKQEVYRIPIEAVVEADPQTATVYVPNETGKGVVQLQLNNYQIGKDFILTSASELGTSREVITDGARYLRPDSPIEIVTESSITEN